MEYEKIRQEGIWSRVLDGAQQPKNGTLGKLRLECPESGI